MLSRILAKWRRPRGETVAAPVMRSVMRPALDAAPLAPAVGDPPAVRIVPDVSPPPVPAERPLPVLPVPDISPLDLLRRVRAMKPEVRQYLHPAGVADDLVRWCQQEGYVGWLTVDEVRAAWLARHEQIGLSSCTMEMVLNALAERPDVRKRRVRLALAPEYAEVRKRLQLMGKRDDRAIIYWIPPSVEDAAAMAAARAAEIAGGNAPAPVPTSKPGRRASATPQRPNDPRSSRPMVDQQPAAPRPDARGEAATGPWGQMGDLFAAPAARAA